MSYKLRVTLCLLCVSLCNLFSCLFAQSYLSNLHATKNDPVYTAYAAPMSRSNYKLDQGYWLMWYDPEKGINFESKDGGDLCLGFKMNNDIRWRLKDYYAEPVITATYSDLVKLYYYPFKNVRIECLYVVYSSQFSVISYQLTNESEYEIKLTLYPYFHIFSKAKNVVFDLNNGWFTFNHNKQRDNWMKQNNIPYFENLHSIYSISELQNSYGTYKCFTEQSSDTLDVLQKSFSRVYLKNSIDTDPVSILAFQKTIQLQPSETKEIRIIRGLDDAVNDINKLIADTRPLSAINLQKLITENEKTYPQIPKINFASAEYEMLYWNAFSLIRQCMMPPEGESSYNYYIFSREPKWGWGYGGQVFHESLVMLAYVFMDPESAMNSQRVYIERQWENGFINYRTGPYLNENIEYNGGNTSSAPWYNYQNYEIYKITKDKNFLAEAYDSGKKFYNYYVSNRDSNNNGLCSWGAHAELESVRDARVAVWDKIGWAGNFEGPDVNAMLVMEEKSLAAMAKELGLENESEEWKIKSVKRSELINEYLWDDVSEFYYNVNKEDQTFSFKQANDLKIKEIIGFLPLWAGVPSKERAELLVKSLFNEEEFWRRFGVPTLSAKDDYYNPIGYWNGPIWVQWQYLIFRGLIDYGYIIEAKELANRVMDNIIHQLKTDHYFWEFYSADDHQAGWNKAYIWTGIIARFLIDLNKPEQ